MLILVYAGEDMFRPGADPVRSVRVLRGQGAKAEWLARGLRRVDSSTWIIISIKHTGCSKYGGNILWVGVGFSEILFYLYCLGRGI